jgi:hypothetical protein
MEAARSFGYAEEAENRPSERGKQAFCGREGICFAFPGIFPPHEGARTGKTDVVNDGGREENRATGDRHHADQVLGLILTIEFYDVFR